MESTVKIWPKSKMWPVNFNLTKNQLLTAGFTFLAYVLVAQFARILFYSVQSSPAVILTPAGVGLAALILYGMGFWPAIALAILFSGLINSTPIGILLIGVVGNVIQALTGVYVLRKLKFDPALTRMRDMVGITLVAVFTTLIGPLITSLGRSLFHMPLPTGWTMIWLGNMLSIIIITPFLTRWIVHPPFKKIKSSLAETLITFFLLTVVNFVIFWTPYTNTGKGGVGGFPVAVIQLTILAWMALRMGTGRMTLALLTTTVIGLTGLFFGMVRPAADQLSTKIVGVELYMIIFGILYYLITAASEERDIANESLKKNIDTLERALQRISSDDRKKNEFIAILAHELRNPLAPILSYLEIMEMEGVKDSKFNEAASGIEHQVQNIRRLLEDLLDISRITQGKIKLKKEKIDVRGVVEKSVLSAKKLIDDQKHELKVALPQEPAFIFADPVRIEQILVNFLNNAAKYTKPNGKIWVTCELEKDNVVVEIKDNGIGIAKETIPTIFEAFSQGDNTLTRSQGGLGIGLNIVRTLTAMHDGTVMVASEGIGRGSAFTVKFPRIA